MQLEFRRQPKRIIFNVQNSPMTAARRTTGRMEQERAHEQGIASGYGAKKIRLLAAQYVNALGSKTT